MPTNTVIYDEDFIQPAEQLDPDAKTIVGRLKASTTFQKGALVTDGSIAGEYAPYDNSVTGHSVPRGILKRACVTDSSGNITFGAQSGGMEHGQVFTQADIWVGGTFRTADLPQSGAGALDTNAIGSTKQFGKIIKGTLANGLLKLL